MKKLILLLFILFTSIVKGQISVSKLDTVSDANGVHIFLEWNDSNTTSTEWTVSCGGSMSYQIGGGQVQLVPNIVNQKKIELTSYNSRIFGWGCFNNQYIKSAWLEIRSNTGGYYGSMIPVPSNYIQIGCKGITTLGQTLTQTGVNFMWDWYSVSASTKLEYQYNGRTITTVYPQCASYSLPAIEGSSLNITVSVICGDGTKTSKSTIVTFPITTTTTPIITSPKKGKK